MAIYGPNVIRTLKANKTEANCVSTLYRFFKYYGQIFVPKLFSQDLHPPTYITPEQSAPEPSVPPIGYISWPV